MQPFIIAEIGINHNGSLDTAKKLIDVAVNSGCNAVKFQKRTISVVYSKEELSKPRENAFGPTNGDLKRGLEFGIDEYTVIDQYCKEKNIPFLSLSGFNKNNKLNNLDGSLMKYWVNSKDYGVVESAHLIFLHSIL